MYSSNFVDFNPLLHHQQRTNLWRRTSQQKQRFMSSAFQQQQGMTISRWPLSGRHLARPLCALTIAAAPNITCRDPTPDVGCGNWRLRCGNLGPPPVMDDQKLETRDDLPEARHPWNPGWNALYVGRVYRTTSAVNLSKFWIDICDGYHIHHRSEVQRPSPYLTIIPSLWRPKNVCEI